MCNLHIYTAGIGDGFTVAVAKEQIMSHAFRLTRRQTAALLLALSAAVVAACGGGGDTGSTLAGAGAGTPSATTYAAGPITGFGSIIVNGVRYDDSTAQVMDDDDAMGGREHLKLGTMVEVDAMGVDRGMGLGRALRIRFGAAIVGPVDAVDVAAGTLEVLGQPVVVTDLTVFDDGISGGLAGLAPGSVVEVHAMFDAARGQFRASRIELETRAAAYRLRGPIANLDTIARTFTIGGEPISYAGAAGVDLLPPLANGLTVRVLLQTAQVDGTWVAVAVRPGLRRLDDRPDAQLRGIVTAFTSMGSFEVNGLKVDASHASFRTGMGMGMGGLSAGTQVEIMGAVSGGMLVATRVELDDRPMDHHRFELHGLVEGLDSAAQTFVLRGIKVWYGGGVTWKNGSVADLANGKRVEVKGRPSADRTRIDAEEIAFE
jgi:hypothetical protein